MKPQRQRNPFIYLYYRIKIPFCQELIYSERGVFMSKLYKLSDFSKTDQILIRYANHLIKETESNKLMLSDVKQNIFEYIKKIVRLYENNFISLRESFFLLSKEGGLKMRIPEHILHEYVFTVGLFDKDSEKQEIETVAAKNLISQILIEKFNICAFTIIEVAGVYKMESTGSIVKEPSIRIEMAMETELDNETVQKMINDLKTELNQETIMYKYTESEIEFI